MKTFLFIDGTNLYSAQYELFGPNKYLIFPKFIKKVEKKINIKFDEIYFYASYSPQSKNPTTKEKHYLKNGALFYRSVKQIKNLFFFTGYRSKTSGKEKEVDVKLAVDIVDLAHQNKYDEVFLISGDADFMEALKVSQRIGKYTSVICIENKIMFKSLLFFKTYIIKFTNKAINFYKIRKVPFFVSIDKNKVTNRI